MVFRPLTDPRQSTYNVESIVRARACARPSHNESVWIALLHTDWTCHYPKTAGNLSLCKTCVANGKLTRSIGPDDLGCSPASGSCGCCKR
jgi:hypothetical protein